MYVQFLKCGEHVHVYPLAYQLRCPFSVVAEEVAGDRCRFVDCDSLLTDTTDPQDAKL